MPSPMMFIWAFRSFTSRTGPRFTPQRTASAPTPSRMAIAANRASSGSPTNVTAAPSPVSKMMRSRGGTWSSALVSTRLNSCLSCSCSATGFFEYSTMSRNNTLQTSVRPELSIVSTILFHAHAGFGPGIRRDEEYARTVSGGCQHHPLGDAELHPARLQVGNDHGEAALQLFRRVGRLYAGEHRARR